MATTTFSIVYNPTEVLFNGIIIFIAVFALIVFYFRKRV